VTSSARTNPSLEGLDELVTDFVIESQDLLDQLDNEVLALELLPDSADALSAIFRTVHSLKGTAALLDLRHLERVCHLSESVLARVRDGGLVPTSELVDTLLRGVDLVRAMLSAVDVTGADEGVDTSVVEHDLGAWMARSTQRPVPPRLGDVLVAAGKAKPEQVALAMAAQAAGDQRYLGQILIEEAGVLQEDVDSVFALQGRGSLADSTTRVDLAALDRLADIATRLLAVIGDVEARVATDPTLVRTGRQLAVLAAMLQNGLTATRRQPVDVLWARMPRLVRDTAGRTGKTVRLETSGGEIAIDRLVVDALKDPLTHLVRDAIAHGIEPPPSRVAAGKPPDGCRLAVRDGRWQRGDLRGKRRRRRTRPDPDRRPGRRDRVGQRRLDRPAERARHRRPGVQSRPIDCRGRDRAVRTRRRDGRRTHQGGGDRWAGHRSHQTGQRDNDDIRLPSNTTQRGTRTS
jgi:two-component system chemotaxis sensor kinase CheA